MPRSCIRNTLQNFCSSSIGSSVHGGGSPEARFLRIRSRSAIQVKNMSSLLALTLRMRSAILTYLGHVLLYPDAPKDAFLVGKRWAGEDMRTATSPMAYEAELSWWRPLKNCDTQTWLACAHSALNLRFTQLQATLAYPGLCLTAGASYL